MKVFTSRLLVLLFLYCLLLIAVASVHGVIADRLHFRAQALASVSEGMAGAQRIAGPVLVLPYTEHYVEQETLGSGEQAQRRTVTRTVVRNVHVLPERLDAEGNLTPDARRRGLFETAGYVLDGRLRARFELPAERPAPSRPGAQLVAGTPFLLVEVSDPRGLRSIRMQTGGEELKPMPGSGLNALRPGVHAVLPAGTELGRGAQLAVEVDIRLGGSERLDLLPLGGETSFELKSSWPHPSFVGRFLPDRRTVSADGFEARWQTSAFASQARGQWLAAATRPERGSEVGDTLTVALVQPVDIYSLADRATKYGHLFIGLTFVLFVLYELMKKLSIHPVQYLLVGLALALFFLLLLALSEHIGFGRAYAVAGTACVLLIGSYVAAVLRSLRAGASLCGLLGLLYGVLFVILRSEQNALLLGSMLIFVVLAAVMLLTRGMDWNEAFAERRRSQAEIDAPRARPQNP